MVSRILLAALCLVSATPTFGATPGSFEAGGSTLVSAMMMFLGNEDSVYILDKAENNDAQVNGHPAWGSLWDIKTRQAVVMDVRSNTFCASGMHLPNGSFVTFGGNSGVGLGGKTGSQLNPDNQSGAWDSFYKDFDGRTAIRVVNPCRISDSLNTGDCAWYDEPEAMSMKRQRWYSSAEATGEGEVIIIGGFINGGFINRWYPVTDPVNQLGQSEPSYEYYPPKGGDPANVNFLIQAGGLNAYAHAYLMPSGKIMLQANLSTTLWDHVNNQETPLPNMPTNVVRVYPASGATAMLPLTPANNYNPTILFCGGASLTDEQWGDYVAPNANPWEIPASKDCQRLTPEPQDGSSAAYQQDDDMLEGRTMGQFIALPTGKLLVINGGAMGTAAYAGNGTHTTAAKDMPFGVSLSTDPVFKPAIYDPAAPAGKRWSNDGFSSSTIPRLYHSTAILLPDASVLIAGSNPNPDVDKNAFYPTEYRAEVFYPSYFSATVRPDPQGIPTTLSYGGNPFDITIPSTSYSGSANKAADKTTVTILRSGFTTHALNMGQRIMQLNNTYTVNKDGTITLHVSQLPPNPNLFQPGPALFFVNIDGIPSTGKHLIIGNAAIGPQPTAPASSLPDSVRLDSAAGSASTTGPNSSKKSNTTVLIGGIAGGVALLLLIGAIVGFCLFKKKRAGARAPSSEFALGPTSGKPGAPWHSKEASASSTVLTPLHRTKYDETWDASTANLHAPYPPYKDDSSSMHTKGRSTFEEYGRYSPNPYQAQPMVHTDNYGVHESPYHGSTNSVVNKPSIYKSQLPL